MHRAIAPLAGALALWMSILGGPEAVHAAWRVGPWTMDSFHSDGRFSHCRMWAEYENGIELQFAQMANFQLWIGMSHPNWVLDPKSRYTMTLYIDGRRIRRARGQVLWGNRTRLWLDLGHDRGTRSLLRRRFLLTLSDGNHNYEFSLRATNRGLVELESCVRRFSK